MFKATAILLSFTSISPIGFCQESPGVSLPPSAAKPQKEEPKTDSNQNTNKPIEIKGSGGTTFDSKPFEIVDVGLTMLWPKGTTTEVQRGGGKFEVVATGEKSLWTCRVYNKEFLDKQISVSEVMKAQAATIKANVPEISKFEVLEESKTIVVGGKPAEKFVVAIPQEEGKPGLVRALTIFKHSQGHFVFFDLLCSKSEYDKLKVTYNDTLTSVTLVDPKAVEATRKMMIDAGVSLMNSVTDEDLRKAATAFPERWERWSVPSSDGDESKTIERGYRRIQTGTGSLKKSLGISSGKSDPEGVWVKIDWRLLLADGAVADTQGAFFVSFDRKIENWTMATAVRATEKGQKTTKVYRETGAREGETMNVTITSPNGGVRQRAPEIKGAGYISRTEAFLLPQLLTMKRVESDFAFYCYDHESEVIRLRRDSVSFNPKSKLFKIASSTRTQGGELAVPQAAQMRENGEFVELLAADGSKWEPTTIQRLMELWKSKGLPLD